MTPSKPALRGSATTPRKEPPMEILKIEREELVAREGAAARLRAIADALAADNDVETEPKWRRRGARPPPRDFVSQGTMAAGLKLPYPRLSSGSALPANQTIWVAAAGGKCTMPRWGPPYSLEFRAEAVRLLGSSGKTVAELSRELGVSEQTLRRWRRQADDDHVEGVGPPTDERSRRHELERESRRPHEESETLRTADGGLLLPLHSTLSGFHEISGAARRRRFTLNPRGEDRSVHRLARLTAEAIDVGVAVVTLPAKWAANGLRWFADQTDEPPGRASTGQDGDGPVAAE
jgi:transposase